MPSNTIFTAAAAVLALSGMVAAVPSGTGAPYPYSYATAGTGSASGIASATGIYPTTNTSSSAMSTSTSSGFKFPDHMFCPKLSNQVYTDANKKSYIIKCGLTYIGKLIDVLLSDLSKRDTAATSLSQCIAVCDVTTGCIGTSFDRDTGICQYFSEIGTQANDPAMEFALVTSVDGNVVNPGDLITSTVTNTIPVTISSCAASITDCPLLADGGVAIVTDNVVSYTTYCPYTGAAATTVAAAPIACSSCSYSEGIATVYSETTVSGSTTVVAVSTAAIAYPAVTTVANGVADAAATSADVVGTTVTVASVSGGATELPEAFTGAAGHVEAGMGMAAMMAMAVFAL